MVCAPCWTDDVDKRADLAPGFFDRAWLGCARQVLELGEQLLDRVQVGAGGRQEQQVRPGLADGTAGTASVVAAQIIEDDDLTWAEGRHQHLSDIGRDQTAVDWAVEDTWRIDAIIDWAFTLRAAA